MCKRAVKRKRPFRIVAGTLEGSRFTQCQRSFALFRVVWRSAGNKEGGETFYERPIQTATALKQSAALQLQAERNIGAPREPRMRLLLHGWLASPRKSSICVILANPGLTSRFRFIRQSNPRLWRCWNGYCIIARVQMNRRRECKAVDLQAGVTKRGGRSTL